MLLRCINIIQVRVHGCLSTPTFYKYKKKIRLFCLHVNLEICVKILFPPLFTLVTVAENSQSFIPFSTCLNLHTDYTFSCISLPLTSTMFQLSKQKAQYSLLGIQTKWELSAQAGSIRGNASCNIMAWFGLHESLGLCSSFMGAREFECANSKLKGNNFYRKNLCSFDGTPHRC